MISLLNPQLDYSYADYWGEYLPFALENWEWIVKAGCYVPRWYQAPTNALQTMAAGDYNAWTLQIPAGSLILEIMHKFQEGTSGTFQVQITDTGIDHQWFSQPTPDALFYKNNGRNGYVLPKPYPVVAPGNFLYERWCNTAGVCELLFVAAVPRDAEGGGVV